MKPAVSQHVVAVFVTLFLGTPLFAQSLRISTPGTAFEVEGRKPVQVENAGSGRRFRGAAFASITLRGTLRLASPGAAEAKVQRLVVHFRTSANGPSLRAVELRNGSSVPFRIATHLEGDYGARETTKPEVVANVWDFGASPIAVTAQTVVRLDIAFPGGFDSEIDPGELVLVSVGADFPRKLQMRTPLPRALPGSTSTSTSTSTQGVISAITAAGHLLWYRHDGREDGSFRWTEAKKIGTGWNVRQAFSAGDGVVYAVMANGDLLWNRHDGRGDGSFRWAAPQSRTVGTGWNFPHVFSGGGGVIYAITETGDLLWYRHDGRADGSFRWTEAKKVGTGWNFEHVFSDGAGAIYAITETGDLLWSRHDGRADGSDRWTESKKVGTGWDVRQVFSDGDGVIYAVTPGGDLLWNRHDGRADGSARWAAPSGKKVGSGWSFAHVF